jgi:6-phosphofructokinase 1
MGIAVMCSGGDAAGMNPGIRRFVELSLEKNLDPYLIYDGLEGLIDDSIVPATMQDVEMIIYHGGTIIRSSRSKRFFDIEYRKKAYENLKKRGINKLVVFGGDGSFRAMKQFYEDFKINFVGIPSTIDNDIFGTEYCLGVDTALNVIRQSIDDIRDTAASFRRAFVIETMGHGCGYLALISALTSGAEMCLIPELEFNLDVLKERFLEEKKQGRIYFLAIVSEGLIPNSEIVEWFEKEIGVEARATVIGHTQRGGSPTVFDRLMAFEFVEFAIAKLLDEPDDKNVVVFNKGNFSFVSIEEIGGKRHHMKPQILELGKKLAGLESKEKCDL